MVGRGTSPVRLRNRWEERLDNERTPLELAREREWGKLKLRSPSPPSNYIQRDITVRRERATERLGLAFNDGMIETKITEVWNGPCKDAGVTAGMVIVAVDNQGTQTLSLLQKYLSEAGLVFTLSVEESVSVSGSSSRPLSPITSQPVTPAGLPRSIASFPPPTTPTIAAASIPPQQQQQPQPDPSLTTSLVVAPQDEVVQLRLQLEAANVQIRSTQARLQSQSELELDRNEELVVEREKRQKLNTELILERTARNEAEEEVRVLRDQLRQGRELQISLSGDDRHDKIRRGQLEEEIIILRNELQSLKQLLFQQSSGNRERELLLRCFDDERAEWNFVKQELESRLADALAKCESMQHLKSEVEALTAAMQSPAPIYGSRDMAPVMNEIAYSSRSDRPFSAASVTYEESVPVSVTKPYNSTRGLLLSERVRADGVGGPVSPRSRSVSPRKPFSGSGSNDSYSSDRNNSKKTEEPKVPSDLDNRLELIASRARDAIAAAELRASTAEKQASGLQVRLDRLEKDRRSDTLAMDKLRESEGRALRKAQQQLGKDQSQLDKERQDMLTKDQARRDLEDKMRQDQQRLERERNEQEKRWQEAERKAQDLEKRLVSASASVAASAKSGSPTSTVDEIADLRKRAAAVFRAMCLKAGRADTRTLPKTGIPDVLGCGDSWKVLFRGLSSTEEGLVTPDLWSDWILNLAEQSGVSESDSRLEWVEEQLSKSRPSSPASVSSYRGQTTRELQAEAKALDRLNVKKPSNKYADWGYKPSTTL